MFGDKKFIGTEIISVDEKGRIVIPTKTDVEVGEELLFVNTPVGLYLTGTKEYRNDLDRLELEMLNNYSLDKLKLYKEQLQSLQDNVVFCGKVMERNRFGSVKALSKGKYKVMGFRNGLLFEKIEEKMR